MGDHYSSMVGLTTVVDSPSGRVQGELGQAGRHLLEDEPAVVVGVRLPRAVGQQHLDPDPGAGGRPAVDAERCPRPSGSW